MVWGYDDPTASSSPIVNSLTLAATTLLGATIVLEIITVFRYKKRRLQKRLCTAQIVLLLLTAGVTALYLKSFGEEGFGPVALSVTAAFPLVAAILTLLARRGIVKDDKLVRSLDRIQVIHLTTMKKALLYCGIALLTAVLPGCKEMKDDIDTLKRPYPTGITLLQSEITVLNGSTLKVPFRVNPSNYIVQAEDLRLDAIRSQITKASYVTTIPECSLVGVTPYKNQAGETCEGQWIAEIEILDGAYYGDIDFTLGLNYTDADNRRVALTSATFGNLNTRIKLTGDR